MTAPTADPRAPMPEASDSEALLDGSDRGGETATISVRHLWKIFGPAETKIIGTPAVSNVPNHLPRASCQPVSS